eukprot:6206045-Pleurochrysis_carterae.AAC.2
MQGESIVNSVGESGRTGLGLLFQSSAIATLSRLFWAAVKSLDAIIAAVGDLSDSQHTFAVNSMTLHAPSGGKRPCCTSTLTMKDCTSKTSCDLRTDTVLCGSRPKPRLPSAWSFCPLPAERAVVSRGLSRLGARALWPLALVVVARPQRLARHVVVPKAAQRARVLRLRESTHTIPHARAHASHTACGRR